MIDWRLDKILYHSERYNGWGYHFRGLPSPYIWGGRTIQRRGKFIADGKFSITTWDRQPGVASLISQSDDASRSIDRASEGDMIGSLTALAVLSQTRTLRRGALI